MQHRTLNETRPYMLIRAFGNSRPHMQTIMNTNEDPIHRDNKAGTIAITYIFQSNSFMLRSIRNLKVKECFQRLIILTNSQTYTKSDIAPKINIHRQSAVLLSKVPLSSETPYLALYICAFERKEKKKENPNEAESCVSQICIKFSALI